MHDSYIDPNEEELFLCSTSKNELRWFPRHYINDQQYNYLIERNRIDVNGSINKTKQATCNTEKATVTPCEIKCRTRGIVLIVSNCGIIIAFREIYGAESLAQVAFFYLETLDLIPSKYF